MISKESEAAEYPVVRDEDLPSATTLQEEALREKEKQAEAEALVQE